MADFCTCGAQLPPDALFCHKCGKPQREILTPEVQPSSYRSAVPPSYPEPPPPPRVQPQQLNFHNRLAVRIALLAAGTATLLSLPLPFVSWLAGGFLAVYLYCRKTGFRLDVGAGVKIGWITGLIAYGFATVVFGAQQLPDALAGHLFKTTLEQMKNSAWQDPATLQQMTNLVQSDPAMAIFVLLAALFVFVTSLSMVGGALGAKLVRSPK